MKKLSKQKIRELLRKGYSMMRIANELKCSYVELLNIPLPELFPNHIMYGKREPYHEDEMDYATKWREINWRELSKSEQMLYFCET